MAFGIKRQHEPPRIVGDLLKAEIAEKQARSIKYQMTIAKLPLAKASTASRSTARPSTRRWCDTRREPVAGLAAVSSGNRVCLVCKLL